MRGCRDLSHGLLCSANIRVGIRRFLHAIRPTNLVAFVVVVAVVAVVLKSCQRTIIIEPFEVPKVVADRGYTPRVAAQQIIDNIHVLQATSELTMKVNILGSWQRSDLDIEVSTTGFSVKSFASELRTLLPIRSTVISGEVLEHSVAGGFSLRVRANGELITHMFNDKYDSCSTSSPTWDESVRRVFSDAAAKIMARTDPFTLASYYYVILGGYPIGAPAHDHYMSNVERLIPIIMEGQRLDLDTRYRTTVLHGLLLLDHREDEEDAAIDKFDDAVLLSPERALARVNLGVAYQRKGEHRRAEWNLMAAIVSESTFGAAAYSIWGEVVLDQAILLKDRSLYDDARARFEEAIKRDPEYVRAYAGRGHVRVLQDDIEGATADFKTVVDLDPTYLRGLIGYARLLDDAEEYRDAVEWYKRATEENPYNSEAYQDWTEALDRLFEAEGTVTGLVDERQAAEIARAAAFARAGNCEEAEQWKKSAAALGDRWRFPSVKSEEEGQRAQFGEAEEASLNDN